MNIENFSRLIFVTVIAFFAVIFFDLDLTHNYAFADELGFESNSEGIIEKLSSSEKTIKNFFKRSFYKHSKPIEVLYEDDNKVAHIENYTLNESKQFVNLMIHFRTGSAEIDQNSYAVIDELAHALSSTKLIGVKININGHTDSLGEPDYNKILSLQRSLSVKKYLVRKHKISSQRIFAQGFGDQLPITDNRTVEGRMLNRRVEVEVVK